MGILSPSQLKLQERLQERQSLLSKKEDVAAIIQTNEREIKVTVDTLWCVLFQRHSCATPSPPPPLPTSL